MSQAAFLNQPLSLGGLPSAPVNPGGQNPTSPEGFLRNVPTYDFSGSNAVPTVTWKWIGAWLATWVVLAGMAEFPETEQLAVAFAVSAAFAASIVFLPKAKDTILSGVA